jgi:hypothetical protein
MLLLMQSAAVICILTASLPRSVLFVITPAIPLPFRLSPLLQISGLMVHH